MGDILIYREPTGHLWLRGLPTSDWKFASSYPPRGAWQCRRCLRGGLNHPDVWSLQADTGLYRTFPGWWRELPHTRTRNSSRLCDIPQSSCHTRLPPDSFLKRVQSSVFAFSLSPFLFLSSNWSETEIGSLASASVNGLGSEPGILH